MNRIAVRVREAEPINAFHTEVEDAALNQDATLAHKVPQINVFYMAGEDDVLNLAAGAAQ